MCESIASVFWKAGPSIHWVVWDESFKYQHLPIHGAQDHIHVAVTSDIIKVPSREELEQGAEIEIIPADKVQEEIEKQEQQEPTTDPESDEGQ